MNDRRTTTRDEPPTLGPRYAVLSQLGSGAGGAVWRVTDRGLGRDLAAKLLPAGDGAREFELLRRLQHPGTVRVLDMGFCEDGLPWFTMELAQGRPLGTEVAPVSPGQLAVLLARLLETIGFVHDRGWVHGDLKPDNVLAEPGAGTVTLLDFGLAMATDGHTDLRGTPGFIAPEVLGQTSGVSVRSDLYAVGAMGWAALTGRLPFPAEMPSPGLSVGDRLTSPGPRAAAITAWLAGLLHQDPDLRPTSA